MTEDVERASDPYRKTAETLGTRAWIQRCRDLLAKDKTAEKGEQDGDDAGSRR